MTDPSTTRLRVLFAIPHLARGGGAERVLLTLLQHLDRRRFEPHLVVLDASLNQLQSELPQDVPVFDLGVRRVRQAWRPLRAAIRESQPDVLMSGLGHLNLMIGMMRPLLPRKLAIVGRETSVATAFNAGFRTAALRNFAYRRFYANLDLVVCQSEGMRRDLVDRLAFPESRTRLVVNPVDVERLVALAVLPDTVGRTGSPVPGRYKLIAVGRLSPEKGFDLLIQAIARQPRGRVHLTIVGEGAERPSLDRLIDQLGLREEVRLAGYHANPFPYMRRADALVLSSRYEGLPNVVLEALALGKPVIATPCPGGIGEIVRRAGGVTLAAAVTADALATTIATFAQHGPPPGTIRIDAFRVETIVRQYESLLFEAATTARERELH